MNVWKRISQMCFLILICGMVFSRNTDVMAKDIVIVLDAGHGGSEAGATRTFSGITYKEEVINMKLANYCKAELETYAGVTVYMTRTTLGQAAQDRETRINIAKAKGADALVSLHINSTGAASQKTATGAYCCVPSYQNYPAGKSMTAQVARDLASSILKNLNSQIGLKNNGFWYDDELGMILFGQKNNYTTAQAKKLGLSKSLLNARIPSMIVEHCFINNPNDCKMYIQTDAQIQKMAVADAAGIAEYYGLKKKGTVTAPSNPAQTTPEPVKSGKVKQGNSWYLYKTNGTPMSGLVKYQGKYYYASSKGKLAAGWKTIKGKKYYFDKTTAAAKTKWQKIGKYKYYFSTKGVMQKKWVTISKKKYYFSKVNGRLLTNYWLKYNNKWYYLDKNGTPYKSCKKVIKGKSYKFNSKGVCTNKK